jgi:hypothetical protein
MAMTRVNTQATPRAVDFTNAPDGPTPLKRRRPRLPQLDTSSRERPLTISELMTGQRMTDEEYETANRRWAKQASVATTKNGGTDLEPRVVKLTWGDEVEPVAPEWIWLDHWPLGSLTIASGREGAGKSTACAWFAAQVTRGRFNGEWRGRPRKVLYVASEDSWRSIILPRLMAAGVDRKRIAHVEVATNDAHPDMLNLPEDNAILEDAITSNDVGLVVLDPVMSFMDDRINENSNKQVRRVLDSLMAMAERTDSTILGIVHFNKGSSADAVMRASASKAFTDVPRAVFAFAEDPTTGERVMSHTKNSYGTRKYSYTYTLESASIPTTNPDKPAKVSRFVIGGETSVTVNSILEAEKGAGAPHSKKNAAVQVFIDLFREQGEEVDDYLLVPSRAVDQAMDDAGVVAGTVTAARRHLGVTTFKRPGKYGPWVNQVLKKVIDAAGT